MDRAFEQLCNTLQTIGSPSFVMKTFITSDVYSREFANYFHEVYVAIFCLFCKNNKFTLYFLVYRHLERAKVL